MRNKEFELSTNTRKMKERKQEMEELKKKERKKKFMI